MLNSNSSTSPSSNSPTSNIQPIHVPTESPLTTAVDSKKNWAVIGGGIMGLAAAWKLAEKGDSVTILEAGPEPGGLTAAWKLGDIEWDKFYHVILLSDSRLRGILSELGLEKEIQWVQTKTGFFSDGKLYSLSSSFDFLRFPPLNLYQKFRLGGTIFFGSKIRNWRAMEKLLVADWLQKWSGRSTFKKIWQPLLKAKLGEAYQRTSAAFIWSYIDRMYKARRSGMKREMFGYVPGGYKRIIKAFVDQLRERGVTVQCNAAVQRIERDGSQQRPWQIQFGNQQATHVGQFDRVVMTVPYPVIPKSCVGLSQDEIKRLEATEYLGVICTSLLLKQPLNEYYVTNIIDTWVPLTGIIEMGSIVPPERLKGHYLVYLPQYMMSDDSRFSESDDSIHERCLATLEKMFPHFNRDQVVAVQTARTRYVMALPTVEFSQNRPEAILSQPGLYLLNSARIVKGNLNVNETLELLEEEFHQIVWPDHLRLSSKRSS